MTHTSSQKGFTLIELLVVISIIGLLSSVILSSLNSARGRAADAAIKSNLTSVRTAAALEYSNLNGSYNTTGTAISGADCAVTTTAGTIFANTSIQRALAQAKTQNGGIVLYCNVSAAGDAYGIAAPLKTASQWWCVDSSGASRGAMANGSVYASQTAPDPTPAPFIGNADYTCNQ